MAEVRRNRRSSVFWRVSGALVAAQLATGLLAIGFSAWFASDRSADLAESSLRLRLDALAEEVERTGFPVNFGLTDLPEPLEANLSYRFPDPVSLLDIDGRIIEVFYPADGAFEGVVADSSIVPVVPFEDMDRLASGDIQIDRSDNIVDGGWAAAPIYDASGFFVGGVLVQPIRITMSRELAPTKRAFVDALWTVILIAFVMAIGLGAGFTWWMVRPLKKIAARVEQIGSGDFDSRIEIKGDNEIARLGSTVNQMAAKVAESVRALQTTDRLRRELVANVGHDLRTPLAALKGFVEEGNRFLDEGRQDDAVGALESAQRQVDYIQRLVEDLFELSLLENLDRQLQSEPVPIAELLSDAARRHRGPLEAAGIIFTLDIPENLPVIQADGLRLLRVFDNLISNAIRHTPSGGKISLSAKEMAETIEVHVVDTGEGMDAELVSQIFERYYRGDASRTRDARGTGLGLAICRAVAESHGGSLMAESEEGRGTKMTLRLPIDRCSDPA